MESIIIGYFNWIRNLSFKFHDLHDLVVIWQNVDIIWLFLKRSLHYVVIGIIWQNYLNIMISFINYFLYRNSFEKLFSMIRESSLWLSSFNYQKYNFRRWKGNFIVIKFHWFSICSNLWWNISKFYSNSFCLLVFSFVYHSILSNKLKKFNSLFLSFFHQREFLNFSKNFHSMMNNFQTIIKFQFIKIKRK